MNGVAIGNARSLALMLVGASISLSGNFAFGASHSVAIDRPLARALAEDQKKDEKKEEGKEDKGEKIELDKLPKKVVESVKKEMPGSRLTKASKKVEDDKAIYYLDDVKVGKKEWDLKVAEDGTILHKEECHDD